MISRFTLSLPLLLTIASQNVQAEVVTIDVTVKAIDVKDRSITITKATKSKSKDIDLDVSEDAKITVNGKQARLDDLQPGQKAKVSYDSTLEVVSKIEVNGGKASVPNANEKISDIPLAFSALSLTVDEDGAAKLIVDTRPQEEAHAIGDESLGTPVKIPLLGEADVFEREDGRLTAVYDFAKIKNLKSIKPIMDDGQSKIFDNLLTIDADEGLLVLKPNKESRSVYTFSRRTTGPFEIKLHLSGASTGFLNLSVLFHRPISVVLNGQDSPLKGNLTPGTILVEQMKDDKTFETLLKEVQPPGSRMEYDFSLGEMKTLFQFASTTLQTGHTGSVGIRRIEVTGKFVPEGLGANFEKKGQRVAVKKVINGSVAAAVGIKEGDILLNVNDQNVDSAETAGMLLRERPLLTDTVLEIERFGKKRKIIVKPR